MRTSRPRSAHETACRVVSLIMGMVKRPTSKTGRYVRWVPIGWTPIPYAGRARPPVQDRFRLKVRVVREEGAQPDTWASVGDADDPDFPHMEVCLNVLLDDTAAPRCYAPLCASLHQTVRHELEHLMDEGYLALPGPRVKGMICRSQLECWQRGVRLAHWHAIRRRLFVTDRISLHEWSRRERQLDNSAFSGRFISYMACARELHPFVKGFQAEARYRRVEWDVPALEYVMGMVTSGVMTDEEAIAIMIMLVRWAVHVIPHAPIRETTLARFL